MLVRRNYSLGVASLVAMAFLTIGTFAWLFTGLPVNGVPFVMVLGMLVYTTLAQHSLGHE